MLTKVSGIILAGGMSRRLGRDKAIEEIEGQTLIERAIDRLSLLTNEVIVVVNSEERALSLCLPNHVKTAIDIYPSKGSLGGIYTGVLASNHDWNIVVACDMPFLNVDLLRNMLSFRGGTDAIVPILNQYPEPTHAIYSKNCLPFILQKIETDELKIDGFFSDIKVHLFSEEQVNEFDPNHLSFFNINSQKDLDKALKMIATRVQQ